MGRSAGERARGRGRRVAVDGALLAVVVGGAVLRFWGLGAQSLWYDEWLTVEATSGGLLDLARHVADREGNPPAYFLLVWGWVQLFGDGEAALRAVSALAGVATIPVMYAAVRELAAARRVALAAALLVAVNPMLVWYSQEARPYSLLALLATVSLLAFARLGRRGGRRDWVAWSVTCAGLVAVHYFAIFLVAAQALALLVAHRPAATRTQAHAVTVPTQAHAVTVPTQAQAVTAPTQAQAVGAPTGAEPDAAPPSPARAPAAWRETLRRIGVALVPSGLVLAALAPLARRQHSHEVNRRWISAFPVSDRLADAGRSALVGPSPPLGWLWLVPAMVIVLVAVLLAVRANRADRRERAVGLLAAAIGAVTVALAAAVTVIGFDVVLGRHLIVGLIPLVVAVAAGLTARPGWRWGRGGAPGLVGLIGVVALGGISLVAVVAVARDPDLQRAEWRQVAEATERGDGRRALVINVHGDMASPLHHYLKGSRPLDDGEAVRVEGIDVLVATPTDSPCNLLVGRGCGMIFLGAPPPDPLGGRLRLVQEVELDQFRIDRYRAGAPVTVTGEDLVRPLDRAGALVLVVPGSGGD